MTRTTYNEIVDKIETAARNHKRLTLTPGQVRRLMSMIYTSTLRNEADNYDKLLDDYVKHHSVRTDNP